jgi:hypothetical membrane protein
MSNRATAAVGVFAVGWFWVLLLVFAAVRVDGYSHVTKAVSELGSTGAPNGLAWNVLGFGVTGLALAVFGWGLGRAVEPRGRRTAGWLAGSGLAFAATAVPADMDALDAPASLAHIAASLLVFVFWLPAAWTLARRRQAWPGFARVSTIALWASAAAVVVRALDLAPPGLGQRLSFAVYFGWVLAAALLLWRSSERRSPARPDAARRTSGRA